jgi:MFS transporter, DHA1 family, tetracycline resistance protein
MLIGPGIFSVTFATFIAGDRAVKFPGAPWYLAAFLLLVAAAVARAVAPKSAPVATRQAAATQTS